MQNPIKIQSTLSTVSPLISSAPAAAVSAPSSAIGPLLMTSAHLAWTSPSLLPSSCTTSTVPKAGSTLQHHHHVSRVMIKENPGVGLPDSVRMVEAALLSPHLLPACKLCWSPSTWWLQRASTGWPARWIGLVLEAGIGCLTTTGRLGILCQVWIIFASLNGIIIFIIRIYNNCSN